MVWLKARGVSKAWADRQVLRSCDLSVAPGDRVGLVGPNGCGKSTFLKILAGREESDGGTVDIRGTTAMLGQEPILEEDTVGAAVDAALAWHGELVAAYEEALSAGELERAGRLQDRLDHEGWDLAHQADAMLLKVGAPPRDARVERLSGGERRRVALARTLLSRPDILFLDEPTNHLDAATIDQLQQWLLDFAGAVVLVTHDRYLLEAVATGITEVEDGETVAYEGSYADFLIARAERQEQLARAEESRQAMIRREAAWASRSPAARSTKQKARLQRLETLQNQRPLAQQSAFSLDFETGFKQGQTVIEARGLRKAFGDQLLFDDLDLSMLRGERIGILGPNGAGKSTLMHALAGRLEVDAGEVVHAPRTRVALLDQHRSGLDLSDTVYEAAGEGNDRVKVGERWVHVAGFLQRFLFPKRMHDQDVSSLSGGERARLLLAKMMLQGANLLLLDEPTNDLDLMTLRVLEEALLAFDGSALIVTHDRAFLDRVCTAVLAFEGDGVVVRYADRHQAMQAARRRAEDQAQAAREAAEAARPAPAPDDTPTDRPKPLSWQDKADLEALPERIEALEAKAEAIEAQLADPSTYADGHERAHALNADLQQAQEEASTAWARWEALAERAEALGVSV